MTAWDPIGVGSAPERDFMGVLTSEGSRGNLDLAEQLVAWHEWSFEHGGRPPVEWIDD